MGKNVKRKLPLFFRPVSLILTDAHIIDDPESLLMTAGGDACMTTNKKRPQGSGPDRSRCHHDRNQPWLHTLNWVGNNLFSATVTS